MGVIKRKLKSINNSEGFTLVEVVAAMTLLTISLLVLSQLFPYSIDFNQESRNETIAVALAQEKMEEFIEKFRVDKNTAAEPLADVSGYIGFKRQVQKLSGPSGTTRIKVTVTWVSKRGQSKSMVLETLR